MPRGTDQDEVPEARASETGPKIRQRLKEQTQRLGRKSCIKLHQLRQIGHQSKLRHLRNRGLSCKHEQLRTSKWLNQRSILKSKSQRLSYLCSCSICPRLRYRFAKRALLRRLERVQWLRECTYRSFLRGPDRLSHLQAEKF
jgi:hypothetical protein